MANLKTAESTPGLNVMIVCGHGVCGKSSHSHKRRFVLSGGDMNHDELFTVSIDKARTDIFMRFQRADGRDITINMPPDKATALFHVLGMILECDHHNDHPELDYQDRTP
jgi:hypothetical protein